MDRIDMFVNVPRISISELRGDNKNTKNSLEIRKIVENAKNLQKIRFE